MRMDALTLFGVTAVSIMLICYAFERRSPWFTFGIATACIAAAIYAVLQGAWPFAVLEGLWAIIAYSRWWHDRSHAPHRF
jgi:hypothetical protein